MGANDQQTTTLADYEEALLPSWLRKPWGRAWGRASGLVKEGLRQGVKYAVKARFVTSCPDDGLEPIGWERDLERGPYESADEYRDRLWRAWESYQWTDTDKAIVDALKPLGIRAAVVRDRGRAWVRDDSEELGGRFVELGPTAFTHNNHAPGDVWARLWVVITEPPWTFIETYTDLDSVYPTYEAWGAAKIGYGFNAPLSVIDLVRRLVKKWSGSHVLVVNVIVIGRGRVFGFPVAADYTDPTVTWNAYVAYWEGW